MDCSCGNKCRYQYTAKNDLHTIHVYKCPVCEKEWTTFSYAQTPATCTKHLWGFESWGFRDDQHNHEIFWNEKCDRCGMKRERRFDSDAVGLRQAVEVEDPRVLKYLELNNETARFLLPDDDVQDFWK